MSSIRPGYSFINEFRTCPRKWYFHHLCGLKSGIPKASTEIGRVIHLLQEDYYNNGSSAEEYALSWERVAEIIDTSAFFEESELEDTARKIAKAMNIWVRTFGENDKLALKVVGAELEIEAALPNGVVMQGRLDRVFKDDDDTIIVFDTKTTSWSPDSVLKKVELDDQFTLYTWLIHKKYGYQPVRFVPDIVYMRPTTPTVSRPGEIIRSAEQIEQVILGICGDFDRLKSRWQQYLANDDAGEYLFPRHATVCSEFGCEYEDICRTKFTPSSPTPQAGFIRKAPKDINITFSVENGLDSSPIKV